jgi:hypothetical protein
LASTGKKIFVVTGSGARALAGPALHIGQEYEPSAPNPKDIFPRGSDLSVWETVSKDYLSYSNDPPLWTAIFKLLGMSSCVCVAREPPYASPELARLLEIQMTSAGEVEHAETSRMQNLAEYLSAFWERDFAPLVKKSLLHEAQTGVQQGGGQDFVSLLLHSAWIPGTDGRFHTPRNLMPEDSRQLLGEHGVYSAIKKELSPIMVQDLGLCPPLGISHVLSLMLGWKTALTPLSLDMMRAIYTFLASQYASASDEEKASLAGAAIIFVPHRSEILRTAKAVKAKLTISTRAKLRGLWRTAQDCVLVDKTYLIDGARAYVNLEESDMAATASGVRALKEYYCPGAGSQVESFFTQIGVQATVSDQAYLKVVAHAQALHSSSEAGLVEGRNSGRDAAIRTYALGCVLRIFVHWSYEADERDREGEGDDAAASLRAFLLENRLCIPCVCSDDSPQDYVWNDITQVFFFDDREAADSCSFGCRGRCDCRFGPDVLRRSAKFASFSNVSEQDLHSTVFIKALHAQLLSFYTDVLGLQRLSLSLASFIPGAVEGQPRAAGGILALVAALRGLQAWSKRALSCNEREQLQHDVSSLVVVARRELVVHPLAVRLVSQQEQDSWKGLPKKKLYALHRLGQPSRDDGQLPDCNEDTRAQLLTTDLRFEKSQLLADALAMLILARAPPGGIVSSDEHRRKKRLQDQASRQIHDLLSQRAVQDLQQSGKP